MSSLKRKTLYLHIGVGKTGTTSQQAFLSKNREALLQLGLDYLYADDLGRGSGHQNFAKSFIKDKPYYEMTFGNLEQVKHDVKQELIESTSEKVLISSENFELACPFEVAHFLNDIEDLDVKIILFVRSQDELSESVYNQLVKLKNEQRSFKEFFEYTHNLGWYDFLSLANKWEEAFGEGSIVACKYDAKENDSILKLLIAAGVDEEAFTSLDFQLTPENVSIGYETLFLLKSLNKLDIPGRPNLYRKIMEQQASDKELPALVFDSDTASYIRLLYDGVNKKFSKKYLSKETTDFGGRKYTLQERQLICKQIKSLI
ncbi:hypothetical protein AN214_01373 [Pseudoalteromonas sp. P1-9]|uniref:hypothetical protein n=1 Tax=Pseudoalteromonas sp. P1-9 TaxID=1710354 RepID=UPI0006D623BB|nr:hypothetical protein [Pseudoalteromonas sp. P1-9]KPV96552.1 hypothetical protein AN214_01373 [Pseudoalteromonas sp. P1-9]